MKGLTIVVCSKNSESLIENCLKEIKFNAPESELIVVDADSTDKTVEIAKKYADKVISDHRKGLSFARQLGIDNASNDFATQPAARALSGGNRGDDSGPRAPGAR